MSPSLPFNNSTINDDIDFWMHENFLCDDDFSIMAADQTENFGASLEEISQLNVAMAARIPPNADAEVRTLDRCNKTMSSGSFKVGKADNAFLLLTGPTPPHGDIQQPAPLSVLGNDAESGTSEATPAVALATALVYNKDDFKRDVVADLDKIPQETLSAEVIESLHVKHVVGILKKFEGDPRQYDTVSRSAPKVLSNALKKKYKNSEALITDTIGHLKSERRKPRRRVNNTGRDETANNVE
jgi:subtilisin family serine protease